MKEPDFLLLFSYVRLSYRPTSSICSTPDDKIPWIEYNNPIKFLLKCKILGTLKGKV